MDPLIILSIRFFWYGIILEGNACSVTNHIGSICETLDSPFARGKLTRHLQ